MFEIHIYAAGGEYVLAIGSENHEERHPSEAAAIGAAVRAAQRRDGPYHINYWRP